jgi:diphthamide biosynthesis protein 7
MITAKINAPFNCDSVEVNGNLDKVFVGMYQYEESTLERGGGYLITNPEGVIEASGNHEYGCLDAKWIDNERIVIACSDGVVRLLNTNGNIIQSSVDVVENPSSTDTKNIIMTVDSVRDVTATITAKGKVSVIKNLELVESAWQAHSDVMESWCCALNPTADLVASGSDDCCLKVWDTRSLALVHQDKRNHSMGVTCLEFVSDNIILTGSYDERIRKFDLRNPSVPIVEFRSIGGIWRLKPYEEYLLVAACYGGCQVLVEAGDSFKPVVPEYRGHDSMAYGIASLGPGKAVSCSFYDKSVQFWSFDSLNS